MENVQKLKDSGAKNARVGAFAAGQDAANTSISLRGSSMTSPYVNYANYLGEAIKQELVLAGKLAADSEVEISGILLKNEIDVSGFGTGYGDMEARFVVKKGSSIRYEGTKKAHTEWPSSFAGAVAIPRGKEEYPRLVQQLLSALYADKAFVEAIK
jgi:hypothetical protein